MLGRLRMSAEECIDSYAALSRHVFHKKHHLSLKINGQLKDRFDASVLEDAIKDIRELSGCPAERAAINGVDAS